MLTGISNMTLKYVNNMLITTLPEFLEHYYAEASIGNIKLHSSTLRCWKCILNRKNINPNMIFFYIIPSL